MASFSSRRASKDTVEYYRMDAIGLGIVQCTEEAIAFVLHKLACSSPCYYWQLIPDHFLSW